MLWSVTQDNHLFIFWRGELIYKRWIGSGVSVIHDLHGVWWYVNGKARV